MPPPRHPALPRLHVNGQTRSLTFDSGLVQSSMRLDAPDELLLGYTRAMMGFLLLVPAPAHVLMIGLGGGSLVKYCHRHLPAARLTVVELSQDVIDLRDEFGVPEDDARLSVLQAEGAAFVAADDTRYDAILVDGFDGEGQAASLCTPKFYRDCARRLSDTGVLVLNLDAQEPALTVLGRRVGKAFQGAAIGVGVDDGDNRVLFATARQTLEAARLAFDERWHTLAQVHARTLAPAGPRLRSALRQGYLSLAVR